MCQKQAQRGSGGDSDASSTTHVNRVCVLERDGLLFPNQNRD